jgi:hypothetical protein
MKVSFTVCVSARKMKTHACVGMFRSQENTDKNLAYKFCSYVGAENSTTNYFTAISEAQDKS